MFIILDVLLVLCWWRIGHLAYQRGVATWGRPPYNSLVALSFISFGPVAWGVLYLWGKSMWKDE